MTTPAVLTFAYILDLAIGDPRRLPHPVRGIGWLIEKTEKILRGGSRNTAKHEKKAGLWLVLIIVSSVYLFFYFISMLLQNQNMSAVGYYLSTVVFVYLVSTTVATRELSESGQAVIDEVSSGNMEGARKKLSMIVGRDTHPLDERGVLKAVIETISENVSDGIVAPLFYFALGGLPLAMTYKAINTLDSMVGYKNEKYKHMGRASAKLDDIANYIPARLTGILIVISSFIISIFENTNGLNSLKIMLRDGGKHSSPNSGIPEAAMAGAVEMQLGGPSMYNGTVTDKPYIGDNIRESKGLYIEASNSAVMVMKLASFLGLLMAVGIIFIRTYLWN